MSFDLLSKERRERETDRTTGVRAVWLVQLRFVPRPPECGRRQRRSTRSTFGMPQKPERLANPGFVPDEDEWNHPWRGPPGPARSAFAIAQIPPGRQSAPRIGRSRARSIIVSITTEFATLLEA
jgi:hypothetical protein